MLCMSHQVRRNAHLKYCIKRCGLRDPCPSHFALDLTESERHIKASSRQNTEVVLSIAGRCKQAENEQKLPLSPQCHCVRKTHSVSDWKSGSTAGTRATWLWTAKTDRFFKPSMPVHVCHVQLFWALIRYETASVCCLFLEHTNSMDGHKMWEGGSGCHKKQLCKKHFNVKKNNN